MGGDLGNSGNRLVEELTAWDVLKVDVDDEIVHDCCRPQPHHAPQVHAQLTPTEAFTSHHRLGHFDEFFLFFYLAGKQLFSANSHSCFAGSSQGHAIVLLRTEKLIKGDALGRINTNDHQVGSCSHVLLFLMHDCDVLNLR